MPIFLPLLAVLFIGLKLAEIITWSWLWVLAPLWIPAVLVITIFFLIFLGALIFGWKPQRRRSPLRWDL